MERVEPHGGGDGAVELVADQHAVAHQIERLGLDALVVDADGGQSVRHGAVPGHVHDGGAVGERAQLVERGERRAGVGGLVADGPVELGGVPDRFVDGEPQVRGVDDEVVRPRLHRWRTELLGQEPGQLLQLLVPAPGAGGGRARQELPAATDRRGQCAHGLESVVRQCQRLQLRLQAHPVLRGAGPVEVGQVGLLRHREQRRRRV